MCVCVGKGQYWEGKKYIHTPISSPNTEKKTYDITPTINVLDAGDVSSFERYIFCGTVAAIGEGGGGGWC